MPWIALPARSPPSTITSGWYTAAALTNFRKHLSEPCRSVAKYSRVDRPTGSVNRGMRALPVDRLDHLPGPAGVHGIPGVPIHFQTGAHDHPVAVGQDFLDILLVDAGVRQQRQVGDRLARGGQVGHLDAGAGRRAADQDRIETEERRAPGPPLARRRRPRLMHRRWPPSRRPRHAEGDPEAPEGGTSRSMAYRRERWFESDSR